MNAQPTSEPNSEINQLKHDLRQYVAAGVLLTQLPGDEFLDEAVRERLQRLLGLFRGLGELTTPTVSSSHRGWIIDLVQLVDECVTFVRSTHTVPLDVRADGPAEVYGDPVMLKRAVTNVLDNATRAAGHSGRVTVRVHTLPGESLVEVSDNGAGFGQMSSVTGQGLSIVDKALRACHGRLEITSGPGPGTTVRMTIPVQRDAQVIS